MPPVNITILCFKHNGLTGEKHLALDWGWEGPCGVLLICYTISHSRALCFLKNKYFWGQKASWK